MAVACFLRLDFFQDFLRLPFDGTGSSGVTVCAALKSFAPISFRSLRALPFDPRMSLASPGDVFGGSKELEICAAAADASFSPISFRSLRALPFGPRTSLALLVEVFGGPKEHETCAVAVAADGDERGNDLVLVSLGV